MSTSTVRRQRLDLARNADADGVREHQLVRGGHPVRVVGDHAGVDLALERAAERRGQRGGGAEAGLVGGVDDRRRGRCRLLDAHVLVTPRERLGHG